MTDLQAARFCEIFSEGLDSGIGYARILTFLERKGFKQDLVDRLGRALLDDGDKLGEAMARLGLLDAAARKLLLVAEDQGTLVGAFAGQRPLYLKRYENKKKVIFSLVEPLIMLVLAFGILVPIIGNMRELFESSDMMGSISQILILPLAVTLTIVAVYAIISNLWLNTPVDSGLREVMMRMWFMVPVVSKSGRLNAQAMFCRYLCESIRGGMNIFEGLELAVEASNDPGLMHDLDRAFDELERGSTLFDACAKLRSLDPDILEYVGLGEETGRMSEMLERAAELFFERAQETFERNMKYFINIVRLGSIILVFSIAMLSVARTALTLFDGLF